MMYSWSSTAATNDAGDSNLIPSDANSFIMAAESTLDEDEQKRVGSSDKTSDESCSVDLSATNLALSLEETIIDADLQDIRTTSAARPCTSASNCILKPSGNERQKANIRQNALKSMCGFNEAMNRERVTERKTFFDSQTFTVHYPLQSPVKREQSSPSSAFQCDTDDYARYPVALLCNQFAGPFRRFSYAELNHLPVRSALFRPPKITSRRLQRNNNLSENAPSVTRARDEPDEVLNAPINGDLTDSEQSIEDQPASETTNIDCSFCARKCAKLNVDSAQCSVCRAVAHYECWSITSPSLKNRVRRYQWKCSGCKSCEQCGSKEDGSALVKCHQCDRTYHSSCLALVEIPSETWSCPTCVNDLGSASAVLSSCKKRKRKSKCFSSRKSKRARPKTTSNNGESLCLPNSSGATRASDSLDLDDLINGVIDNSASNSVGELPETRTEAPEMETALAKKSEGQKVTSLRPRRELKANVAACPPDSPARNPQVQQSAEVRHRSRPRLKRDAAKSVKREVVTSEEDRQSVHLAARDVSARLPERKRAKQQQFEFASTHPILSAAIRNAQTSLDFSNRINEEVRISKMTPSTHSCSLVAAEDEDEDDQDDKPLDLSVPPTRFTPHLSSAVNARNPNHFN